MADLFNTDAVSEVCHGFDASDSTLKLAASRDCQPGEQLVIGYGPVSNARCLWLYGFAIANNPHDAVDLYATMAPEVPSYSKRKKLLDAVGLGPHCMGTPFQLTLDNPLPVALLLCLRAQHAPKKLLRLMRDDPQAFAEKGKQGAPDLTLERSILQALRDGVAGMLDGYDTSLDEDEEAAERWASHEATLAAADAYRRRMALLLRLGEKRILKATLRN